jgi:hypothetical protein
VGYTKVKQSIFDALAENDNWKNLREKYIELVYNAKDESYPFMLFVNNPRKRSALKNSFLFKIVGKPFKVVKYDEEDPKTS